MLKALGDRWSAYYSPSEFTSFNDKLQGRYTGIGVWVRQSPTGALLVSAVQTGSPADRGGLRTGDEIVSVDGHQVAGQPVQTVLDWLRGPNGSTVAVGLRRATGTAVVTLKRSEVTSQDVTVDRLAGQVLHIRIAAFTRGVGRQVRAAVAMDPKAAQHGIVLDLRDNPGGLVDEAVEVASVFLDGGPVVSYQQRGKPTQTLDALGHGDTTTPLVVLVDGNTASAAEIVAAALQDRNRAVVVGSRTFGKGSVQEPATLSDGSAIELTVGRYTTPSGRTIDGVGVQPDLVVPDDAPPAAAESRALDVLAGLVAAFSSEGRG
jgi:carboxyl-terminal processing protease